MAQAGRAAVTKYIDSFEGEARERLERIRAAVRRVLPDAEESIKYKMPAVELDRRNHIFFAAWKKHIAIYPVYRSDAPIEDELAPFRDSKDNLRFPLNKDQPDELIERVVAHMARQARERRDGAADANAKTTAATTPTTTANQTAK